jgi:CxxC motif-containing protein (DUF1111 family)
MTRSLLLALPLLAVAGFVALPAADPAPTEAPASFQLVTNGFTSQADFLANLEDFSQEATEAGDDEPGLGPSFNGTSCKSCHLNPAVGGGLSRFELRAGRLDPATGAFIAPPGGTLVRQLAVDPAAQQHVPDGNFTSRRRSTSLFGLGYVEAVADATLVAIRDAQDPSIRGIGILVPATTAVAADGTLTQVKRVGRFGWKDQQATLLDFAADALINEIGRTSPIQPDEMPALDGRSLSQFKKTPVGQFEDAPTPGRPAGHDVVSYANFMRSLQAPPRDFTLAGTDDARAGQRLFVSVGCAACHVPTMTTSSVGVADAVGNKVIHPYSDFLLHDVGTGDTEVVQAGAPDSTRKMLRTAPLWGVRTVPEMGHDGRWTTFSDAIEGHGGQAAGARANYRLLTPGEQRQVVAFLRSL